jgi:hypothetical protein
VKGISWWVHTCRKSKDLGMIVGTGWPFGGEYLQDDETCQCMVMDNFSFKDGSTIEVDEASIIERYTEKYKGI